MRSRLLLTPHVPPRAPLFFFPSPRDTLTVCQFNSKGFNYGFVEFDDPGAAERAMTTLNGRRIHHNVRRHLLKMDSTCDALTRFRKSA